MCRSCKKCFSEEEKTKLKKKGWNEEQINFVENSIVEDKIKGYLNWNIYNINRKMDKTIVILLIILVIIFGIFFIISTTGSSNSGSTGYNSYPGPQQYSGGGCGR